MFRILSSFILFTYLFSATEFRQLLKLGSLVDHYTEHKANNQKISFFNFLDMHYAGDDLVESDNERDMELPFKKFDNVWPANSTSIPPVTNQVSLIQNQDFSAYCIPQQQANPCSSFYASIWQPPRLA